MRKVARGAPLVLLDAAAEDLETLVIKARRPVLEQPIEIAAGSFPIVALETKQGALETFLRRLGFDRKQQFEVVLGTLWGLALIDLDIDEIPKHPNGNFGGAGSVEGGLVRRRSEQIPDLPHRATAVGNFAVFEHVDVERPLLFAIGVVDPNHEAARKRNSVDSGNAEPTRHLDEDHAQGNGKPLAIVEHMIHVAVGVVVVLGTTSVESILGKEKVPEGGGQLFRSTLERMLVEMNPRVSDQRGEGLAVVADVELGIVDPGDLEPYLEQVDLALGTIESHDHFIDDRLPVNLPLEPPQLGGETLKFIGTFEKKSSTVSAFATEFGNRLGTIGTVEETGDALPELLEIVGRDRLHPDFLGHRESPEIRFSMAKLAQSHLSPAKRVVLQFQDLLSIDPSGNRFLADTNAKLVPLPWNVGRNIELLEDRPAVDIGSLEASQAEFSATGVESVVTIPAIGGESEAGRSRFVVELHPDGKLVGNLGNLGRRKTERSSAEPVAETSRGDRPATLGPIPSHQGCPGAGVENTDGPPSRHRNGIRFLEESQQVGTSHREAQVLRHPMPKSHHPENLSIEIQHRTAAVPLFDRHRQLEHRIVRGFTIADEAGIQFSHRRNDSGDNAEGKALRRAESHDQVSLGPLLRPGDGQRLQRGTLRVDPDDGEIVVPVPGMDLRRSMDTAVMQFDLDGTSLADHMQVRRDQAVLGNDESRTGSATFSVASELADKNERGTCLRGEFLHLLRVEVIGGFLALSLEGFERLQGAVGERVELFGILPLQECDRADEKQDRGKKVVSHRHGTLARTTSEYPKSFRMKTAFSIPISATLLFVSALFGADEWKIHTIDPADPANHLAGADGVRPADFDGDGRIDFVTGWEEGKQVRVYRNPGPDLARDPWPHVVVGRVSAAEDAVFADLDRDGNLDVVTATEGKSRTVFVHWSPPLDRWQDEAAWKTEPFPQTENSQWWMFTLPHDIDRDGDMDLLVGSKNAGASITWLENPGASARDLSTWKSTRIADAGWIMSMRLLENEEASYLVYSDRKGDRSGIHVAPLLESSPWIGAPVLVGAAGEEVMFLDLARLDDDDLLDIAVAIRPRGVAILYQPADPLSIWEDRADLDPLPELYGDAKAVGVGDIDLDGMPDFAITCERADGPRVGAMWANVLSEFSPVAGKEGIKYDRIELHDLDGDGDLDIVTCEERAGLGVIWFENPAREP